MELLGGDKFEESTAGFREMRNVACGILAVWARLPPLSTEPNRCERAFVVNTIGQANGVYDKPIDLRFCDYTNEKNNLKGKSLAAALMSDAKFDGADMTEVVMSKAYVVGSSFKGELLNLPSSEGKVVLCLEAKKTNSPFRFLFCPEAHHYPALMGAIKIAERLNEGMTQILCTTAVLDRVNFVKANLQGAVFRNTVLSGSTFGEARLEDAVFEDTIIGYIDLQKICRNTTIGAEGRAELGC
ncbi:tetratricopeptide repeat (TPR)-like superfamily protein [Actinidia rufa]|uniref:Tetratricopeptide repeat (TPR)-like superfamily protein n=1 Tax=Actinidia rufa TaxID=165716 RepID=A0A7J0EAC4_9ERIC|nr:tetratricopeptide repeat (TPR)-like superfamily protein [Actinidia rufa]